MKHLLSIVCASICSLGLWAQDVDHLALSDTEIQGTARYVGMGGAFAALGGDVSAVKDNPAALGVFRRNEVSFSIDWDFRNTFTDYSESHRKIRIGLPQVSWVIKTGDPLKQKGLLFNNFILQYQRLKTYNQSAFFDTHTTLSQTSVMAQATQGLDESLLQDRNVWDNGDIGWLSVLGYHGYLIDPDTIEMGNWIPVAPPNQPLNAHLEVYESGSVDEYTFGWGMNISNSIYLGLTANMRTLSYEKISHYDEQLPEGGAYHLSTTLSANGLGTNFALGAIYRPLPYLRIGASFQTPTWMTLKRSNSATMRTQDIGTYDDTSIHTPLNVTSGRYMLPMRVVGGVAYQIGMMGLVSIEYDYSHSLDNYNTDMHFLKAGTEWVIARNFFVRAGYAYQSSFQKNDRLYAWAYNDTRTDTDFRISQDTHYISAGLGWRNKYWIVDCTYQFRLSNNHQYLFAEYPQALAMQEQAHRIVLSLGWTR